MGGESLMGAWWNWWQLGEGGGVTEGLEGKAAPSFNSLGGSEGEGLFRGTVTSIDQLHS